MFLKSLEIQGFKSFPDKTTLNFKNGITAIVGPNGSGKSNLSDAVRWVLGEVSSKALRGNRMEDVIFGGAVGRKPLGFAEVSLTLENSEKELDVDGDVKITRRYYRSGESEYLLNGKEVRLKDIHELLMDTGLGRDGYSIIGQGRIEDIVGAKSEDRREIFEEAAGISKYRYRKEESERRLSLAEDNLVRLRDILSELETRVGPLKEQSEKAKKYIDLASQKKTLEIGLWLNTLDKQRETLREQDNRLEYSNSQYNAILEKLESMDKEIENAYMNSQHKSAEIEEIRKASQELEENSVKKKAEADILKNDISHNNENIERIKEEIKETETSSTQSSEQTTKIKAEIEEKNNQAEKIQTLLTNCENGVEDIIKQNEGLTGEIKSVADTISSASANLSEAKIERNGAELSIQHIEERFLAIDNEIKTKDERVKSANESLIDLTKQLEATNQKMIALTNEQNGYQLKFKTRKEKADRLDETIRSFSLQYDGKIQKANMLSEMEKNLDGFSFSVKRVMKEKASGILRGIHAPVSKLIHVPSNISVAVETALGFSAQHIVVDNEQDAKDAIRLLKASNAGRATFLPISSIEGRSINEMSLTQQNGFVGVASELVSSDEKYKNIVRNLLGRTIIVEDLDSATDIARRYNFKYKIVTLDGQLVNAGGSMTGGSTNKNIGLLSRAGEIAEIQKQALTIKNRIAELQTEKSSIDSQLAALEAKLMGIKAELSTSQEDKIRFESDKNRYSEQISTLNKDILSLSDEKKYSLEKKEKHELTVKSNNEKIQTLSDEIEVAQKKAEELGMSRIHLVEMQDERNKKLSELRLELLTARKDVEALNQKILTINALKENSEQHANDLLSKISEYQSKIDEAKGQIENLLLESENLHNMSKSKLENVNEISTQREQIEKKTIEMRTLERSLNDDKEKISEELARLDERKASTQTEYDTIIQKLYDEYELTRSEAEKTVEKIDNIPEAQKNLNKLKAQIKAIGSVNVDAIEEYNEVSTRYKFMKEQTDDIENSKEELNKIIYDLTSRMRNIFAEQFELINKNFGITFKELFGGGMARLEFSDPTDVLSSGIEIIVQPPGKIIKNLSMLSGGERAFVAIAIYLAILKVKPSPFCVLDEIEAALDDGNISRFTNYLHNMSGQTQFIVITHRRITMDGADVLYGVTMQDEGVSKLLHLDVNELVEKLGIK